MNMNPEHDLVYITQPSGVPDVWDRIAFHRAGESPYAELKLVHEGQTKSMQHILLAYNPEEYRRECAGCHTLSHHFKQLRETAYQRATTRAARAERGCKMCRQVQQQLQHGGTSPAEEAAIRERLLRERMSARLLEVRRYCRDLGYSLGYALHRFNQTFDRLA
jgi:hypothetical protein